MSRSLPQYLSYSMMLILVGSIFSVVVPSIQQAYAAQKLTFNVDVDPVSHKYGTTDTVAFHGKVSPVVTGKTASIKVYDPSGSQMDSSSDTPTSQGDFYGDAFDVPSSGDDGVWTVQASYNGVDAFSYFIVDDNPDDISVHVNSNNRQYEAGDQVTITGNVGHTQTGHNNVVVTVIDPNNDNIVDQESSALGAGSLSDDAFKYSFTMASDASPGRYAVEISYNVDNQEGSTLFEIPDSGSSSGSTDFTGDSDNDGHLTAQIEKDSYNVGNQVSIEGAIDNYDSSTNDDLNISVKDPDGVRVSDYSDSSATVQSSGDFAYDFDLADDAASGTYSVTILYAGDQLHLTFDVGSSSSGGTGGGATSGVTSGDLTVKLDKSSYKAGDTMTVSGKAKHVADPKDEEQVSILLYKPSGEVILSSAKYVTPPSTGDFSASVFLSSNLAVAKNYLLVVSYLQDEVKINFDITGVSSNPTDIMTVKTDKTQYAIGNTVKISGSVPSQIFVDGQQLLIKVSTPDGGPCRLDPVDVSSSGAFTYDLVLGGKCGVNGQYDVEATYNGQKSKTTFVLAGSSRSSYGLSVAGKSYAIEYELVGGSIKSMFARTEDNKLVVNLNTQEDGKLTLVLPRSVIDAIKDGKDIEYVVTIEDESGNISTVTAEETGSTDATRTLGINYKAGADRIEIAGTQIVPEFGPLASIIMAISILGTILVTATVGNKLSLFRKS